MKSKQQIYQKIKQQCEDANATLVVVSKFQPIEKIKYLYDLGQRDFGENRVQDLLDKKDQLPSDIRWHVIGTLQRNKVKYIAPFVHLIHSIDTLELLEEVHKQALKNHRQIPVLLQVHIAQEESKHGFTIDEIQNVLTQNLPHEYPQAPLRGMMGMATYTDDQHQINQEFQKLYTLYHAASKTFPLDTLSMGMSSDYELALANHSTMIRVGSLIFDDLE